MKTKFRKFLAIVLCLALILGTVGTSFAVTSYTKDGPGISWIATDQDGKSENKLDFWVFDSENVQLEAGSVKEGFSLDGAIFIRANQNISGKAETNVEKVRLEKLDADGNVKNQVEATVTSGRDAAGNQSNIKIKPIIDLELDAFYQVVVEPGIQSNKSTTVNTYIAKFKTIEILPAPIITSTTPVDGTMDCMPTNNTKITVSFKDNLDKTTITTDSVKVFITDSGSDVMQTIHLSVTDKKIEMVLEDGVDINTSYKVVLDTTIKNSMDVALEEPYIYSFKTRGLVYFNNPRPDLATEIPIAQPLYLDFLKVIDKESIGSGSAITVEKIGTVENLNSMSEIAECVYVFKDDLEKNKTELTISPKDGKWEAGSQYKITVPASVATATGKINGYESSVTFITQSLSMSDSKVRLYRFDDPGKVNILDLQPTDEYTYAEDIEQYGKDNLRAVIPGTTYVFEMDIENQSMADKKIQTVFEARTGLGTRPNSGGYAIALMFDNDVVRAKSQTTASFIFELKNDEKTEKQLAFDVYVSGQNNSLGATKNGNYMEPYHLETPVVIPRVTPGFQISQDKLPVENEKNVAIESTINFIIEERDNGSGEYAYEGMDVTTINSTNIKLLSNGVEVPSELKFTDDGSEYEVTLTPTAPLNKGTVYEVKLLPGLKDSFGQGYTDEISWKFATSYDMHFINPSISFDKAWSVATDATLGVGFVEGITREQLSENGDILLTKIGTKSQPYSLNMPVSFDYSISQDSKLLSVKPKENLDYAGQYHLSINGQSTEFYTYGISVSNSRVIDTKTGDIVSSLEAGKEYKYIADITNRDSTLEGVQYEVLVRSGNGARSESGGSVLYYDLGNKILAGNETQTIEIIFNAPSDGAKKVYFDVLNNKFDNRLHYSREEGPTAKGYHYNIDIK